MRSHTQNNIICITLRGNLYFLTRRKCWSRLIQERRFYKGEMYCQSSFLAFASSSPCANCPSKLVTVTDFVWIMQQWTGLSLCCSMVGQVIGSVRTPVPLPSTNYQTDGISRCAREEAPLPMHYCDWLMCQWRTTRWHAGHIHAKSHFSAVNITQEEMKSILTWSFWIAHWGWTSICW